MEEVPLGTQEASKIAGRHQRTIVSWIQQGKLPAMKMPGERGIYLIKRSDLESLLTELNTPKPYVPKAGHEQG